MLSRAEAADQLRLGLGARLEVGSSAWAATEALNECPLELAGLTTILGGICNYVFLSSCFYMCQLCPLLAHFLSQPLSLSLRSLLPVVVAARILRPIAVNVKLQQFSMTPRLD